MNVDSSGKKRKYSEISRENVGENGDLEGLDNKKRASVQTVKDDQIAAQDFVADKENHNTLNRKSKKPLSVVGSKEAKPSKRIRKLCSH